MKRFFFLIFSFAVGLGGYASAAIIHRTSNGFVATTASGVIGGEGRILRGSGFTVEHPQRGDYVVTFAVNFFAPSTCAALVVEGVHRSILSHAGVRCSGSVVSFDVHIEDPDGTPSDHTFGFVAGGMQSY